MKRFYFLLISFLTLSFIVIAQVKMFVHQSNGNIVEILASRVDSISLLFPSKEEPDDPDVPVEPVFYTISFDANGGTGTLSSEELEENKTYVIPSNVFIREGYKFIGWNTKSNGTGVSYTEGQNIIINNDLTLYAQWEEVLKLETIVLSAEQIDDTNQIRVVAECSITPQRIVWFSKTENGTYREIQGENNNVLIITPEPSAYTYVKANMVTKSDEVVESLPIIISSTCLSVVFNEDFGTFERETDRTSTPHIGPEYTYVDGCNALQEEGTYAVMVNPKFAGNSPLIGSVSNSCEISGTLWYRDIYDHTQGGLKNDRWGGLLLVNADAELVYSREVDVTPNTLMIYSAWVAYASNQDDGNGDVFNSEITFVVRDTRGRELVEMPLRLEGSDKGWQKGEVVFNTEENSIVTIELYNYNRGGDGNDFVIDDISFTICDEQNIGIIKPTSISFNANGGVGNNTSDVINPLVHYLIPSNSFTREGYFFTGWNTKADGTGETLVVGQSMFIKEDLTLYAQWVKGVTVSFNANGGNGAMNSMLINPTKSFKIPTNTFTNEDNFCKGWNTKADGTGTAYAEAQTISITESVTLYAQWEKLITTGIENGHGYVDLGLPSGLKWATMNVGAESPEDYGDYFAWGETTTKSTYDWDTYKWCEGDYDTQTKYCTDSYYGTVDNKTILDLSDDAANVNWGGDWRMPTKAEQDELRSECTWTRGTLNGVQGYKVTSKSNGNSIFLPAAGVYRSYLYNAGSVGYYWSSSLYTYYSEDAYYLGLFSNSVSSSGYYRDYGCSVRPVSYIKLSFSLMFSGNGGKGTMPTIKAKEDEQISIPSNPFTRTDYEFVGWNTKADGSGASYTAGENLTLTTDLTLYAQWKEIIKYYTLSFNANGGNGSMNSIELEEGKNFTIPSNPFTRTDYEFVGWNTKADGSGASYTAGENLTLTTDLTLYAQWKEIIKYYTLSFNANGGNGSMNSIELEEGKNFTIPSNPFTRTDYEFIGWNTKADGTGTPYTDKQSITPTENLTLYAQWEESKETGTANGYAWVDLGLPSGTKWATMNVGATSPEGYGDYFAWGETKSKSYYDWSTYKWCNGSFDTMTKYCTSSSYGTVDNKTTLDLSDDAAYVNWGSSWRMPTEAEQDELSKYTTWTPTTQNGVEGYKVTSNINGNSIFLPAAGYRSSSDLIYAGSRGYYWSSSLSTSRSYTAYSWYFYSYTDNGNYDLRNYGHSVRPVLRDVEFTFTIMFDGNGGEGTMPAIDGQHDDRVKIPASTFTREGYYFASWNTKADGTGTSYNAGEVITQAEDLTLYAQWEESKETGTANGYAWVDLGLPSGTKWATMNVGADSPEEYGDYFAWGETNTKYSYTSSTYSYSSNPTTLPLDKDAAYINWGPSWRMPTRTEQNELSNTSYTTWTWTTQNGVKGYKVTSKINGNSIFLPATGHRLNSDLYDAGSGGLYWSSSLDTSSSNDAYLLYFGSDDVGSGCNYRLYGHSVRPVLRDVEFTFTIMFDGNGGEGTMPAIDGQHDDRVKIPASTFTREGYYFASWNTKADGTGTSYKVGEAITQAEDLTLYAQWEPLSGTSNGYTWVDLGLPSGTRWATINVGADSPEEYGDYFAWGETNTKSSYITSSYSSNPTTLPLDKDAAYINWGPSWRMPTRTEQNELSNTSYTTWTWTTQNGVKGYKVTSKINGNSIFLPATGCRYGSGPDNLYNAGSSAGFWSSSLTTYDSDYAYGLYFNSANVYISNNYRRYYGQSVRPVLNEIFTLGFDGNGGSGRMSAVELDRNESTNIPANTLTRRGYKFIGWNTKADGTGTPYTEGQTISLTKNTTLYAQWEKFNITGTANGHDYVDLGLPSGTLWATCNVGAEFPEDYGDYFAWGETTTKSTYNWSNYKWCKGDYDTQTKYCTSSSYGTVDNKTTLDLSDDAAYVNWGRLWRMPAIEEQDELRNTKYTTWTWTKQNGVNGYKVTSRTNGNSIFLPAAGYRPDSNFYDPDSDGKYWSSSLITSNSSDAYCLFFDSGGVKGYYGSRGIGWSVRPVLQEIFTLRFDGNGGGGRMSAVELDRNESTNIPANTLTRRGYKFIGWNTKADGTGTPYTEGQTISLTKNTTLYAQWEKFNITGTANGHDYVDLGLPSGTLWATCNVGAEFPEDYGDYFAWGETTTKSTYNWSNYKWCKGDYDTQTKYCTSSSYGTVDNNTILDLSDDAAYVNWGSSWRMPTDAELKELKDNCTWTPTTQNGVKGYKVTSIINGNSIFLPAAGYRDNSDLVSSGSFGNYWSSSLYTGSSRNAYYFYFTSDNVYNLMSNRYGGHSVRPVLRDVELTFTIMFDSNGGEGTMPAIDGQHDDRMKIPASTFTREGYYFASWNTKADGTGTSYKVGEVITQTEDLILYAQWEESKSGTANGYAWVDLGLPSGTKWATMNVGADSPEEYGDYFAWGETTPKSTYNWSTYKWCKGDDDTQTKYCTSSSYGTVDNKTILDLSDDAAYVNWGPSWRMPTRAEQDELRNTNYTTWTWTTQNGVNGYKVTSKTNGNSIFLPAAGYRGNSVLSNTGSYCYYWSSSLNMNNSNNADNLYFKLDFVYSNNRERSYGQPVRPVLAE